jgi:pimeloyl-ACP methyl ester carboxylesterase
MLDLVSKDGTKIACEKSGKGAPLILMGGSLADHHFYMPLAQELARQFTVYNFDRRGRGQSGDTPPYAVEREFEDVSALIGDAKEPVLVYGHSAGSALALRAAAAGLTIRRLVLADPPYTPRGENDEAAKAEYAEQVAHIRELNEKGDFKGSAKFFLGGYGLSDEELEEMFRSPSGASMLDAARALPYDYAMMGDGLVPTELAGTVSTPTLILAAEAVPDTAAALAKVMPHAQFLPMKAMSHELSPTDITKKIVPFFAQP